MEAKSVVSWSQVARMMLWLMTVAFVSLFLLEVAVVLRFEFALAWTSFAMFFGTLLWFFVVVYMIREGRTNSDLHDDSAVFLIVEVVCLMALVVSLLGHFYDVLLITALIFNLIISLVFCILIASLCMEVYEANKKYRRIGK